MERGPPVWYWLLGAYVAGLVTWPSVRAARTLLEPRTLYVANTQERRQMMCKEAEL